MDPNNPIVQLCCEGMNAEFAGKPEEASALFMQAWEQRVDELDACIAAHYVARHQATPEETLRWNQLSLDYAAAVGDERVGGFYPSLYLNLGKSYENLGRLEEARVQYRLAAERIGALGEDEYGAMIRKGIAAGLERTA